MIRTLCAPTPYEVGVVTHVERRECDMKMKMKMMYSAKVGRRSSSSTLVMVVVMMVVGI